MSICRNCGAEIPAGYNSCPNCGAFENSVDKISRRSYEKDFVRTLPLEFRPLSPWAYFGYSLLFSVPIVGFIIVIVFACGGALNVNLRKFARYYVIMTVFGLILTIVLLSILANIYGDSISAFLNIVAQF